MYFVCDFIGRWLKDLNFFCCVYILLTSVEGRLVGNCTSRYVPLKWKYALFLNRKQESYHLIIFGRVSSWLPQKGNNLYRG